MLYHLIAFSAAVAPGAADEDCVGYHYKINGVCTGVQQFPGATGCGTALGGKDSHPLYLDKAFCEEFGTGRDTLDQQVSMVSWGNLGKASVPEYKGEVNDPTMPSGCVTHAMHNFYQWNNAANGAANGWWRPVCMQDVAPPPTAPPTDRTFTKCKEYTPDRAMSIKNGGDSVAVQLCKVINGNVMTPMWDNGKASDCGTNAALIASSTDSIGDCQALCDAHPKCLGWWMWDQTILPAPFTKDDQGCYLFEHGTADQLVPDRVMDSAIAAGVCFPQAPPAPSMPPTEPPTDCDCRKTDATHAEGARCMDPHGNTIGYRQTVNWCCSDYGCSKGYEWVNPADDQCKDDTFVGTCMFNFIGAGGCNSAGGNDDAIIAAVDPACFDCDHIGDLVEQECTGQQGPLSILSNMIKDARRLSGTPLPASDPELVKMNKRIAKIRTELKQKKIATKTALGKHP